MNTTTRPSRFRRRLLVSLIGSLGAQAALAAEPAEPTLAPVEINASALGSDAAPQPDAASPATVYTVSREAMRLFDTPGGTNPYTALAEIPGVRINTVDAWGLNNMQGGQKGMRVRGEISTHGVSGTLEGLALNGPGPGPGYLFLFDKENLAGIVFAQGAVSADRAGLFNTYGAIDTRLLWPRDKAYGEVSTTFGDNNFQRYFGRADSGLLATGTRLMVSTSHTTADKWRGYGDAPGNRENYEIAVSQQLGDLEARLWLAHNDQSQNNYRALTYAQARDLGTYFRYDYANNRTSSDHFDYNRQDFTNDAVVAEFAYRFTPATRLTVKPYYANEKGYYLYAGSNATQVQKWILDHETYGITGELQTRLADTDLKLGYAWTSTAPPGPPTTRKQYSIVGGNLVFQQWSLLAKMTDRHEFEQYYAVAEKQFGALTLQGGTRYAIETLPGIISYNTATTNNASWDVSPEAAFARATPNPTRSVKSRSFAYWLPQVGTRYDLSETVELRANLGRNIGAPSFDAFNQAPAGSITTSQGYWDQLKPELSTSLDLGARFRFASFYLDPTVYFSRSQNKGVNVFNPATSTVYSQNVGKTRASGFQLAAGGAISSAWQWFSALSYSLSAFREDVQTTGGAVLSVKGKQLPDVPKVMANAGAVWRHGGFSLAPLVQYVGPRWSTITYSERIPGYFTADLTASYRDKGPWGGWEASLAVLNALDRRYIGQVSTSEVNTTANGAIYYPGAPRTLAATLHLDF